MGTFIDKYDFKNGDVILVHNYSDNLNPLPILIQAFTKCYYHHCAVYYDGFIYESTANGVEKGLPILQYLDGVGSHREIAILRIPNFNPAHLFDVLGQPYNFLSLPEQIPNQLFGIWIGSNNPKSKNCSQLIAYCLWLDDWAKWTPADVWNYAIENEYVIKESHPKRRSYINARLHR